MKQFSAWIVPKAGLANLQLSTTFPALPALKADELLIHVKAISVNPVDFKLINHPPGWTLPHIPGVDGAGVVAAVGEEKDAKFDYKVDERVAFHHNLMQLGTFAQFVIVKKACVARIPAKVSFETAAALPCAAMTAYQALDRRMHVAKGKFLLVTGASGGVGGFAVQLGAIRGARVIGLCSAKHVDYVKGLGAEFAIDYHDAKWPEKVREITNGIGVNAALDCVSPATATQCMSLLRFNGQLSFIAGAPDYSKLAPFTIAPSFHEVALGGAYGSHDPEPMIDLGRMLSELLDFVDQGKLKDMITTTLPFSKLHQALDLLQSGKSHGKIVCTVE